MTVFEDIKKFNKERGLLKEFNMDNEVAMLKEELQEFIEATSEKEMIDALCDIIVVATGGILKLGYDPEKAMKETTMEILSRKGKINESGKFIKDKNVETYKADYKKAKVKKEDIMAERVRDIKKAILKTLQRGKRISYWDDIVVESGEVHTIKFYLSSKEFMRLVD